MTTAHLLRCTLPPFLLHRHRPTAPPFLPVAAGGAEDVVESLGERLEPGARLVGPVLRQPQHLLELLGVLLGQPPRQLDHVQAGPSHRRTHRPTLGRRASLSRHVEKPCEVLSLCTGKQAHWLSQSS
jgi:hypothetical protein